MPLGVYLINDFGLLSFAEIWKWDKTNISSILVKYMNFEMLLVEVPGLQTDVFNIKFNRQNVVFLGVLGFASVVDVDLTSVLFECMLNPWVVIFEDISHNVVILKEEIVGEEVIVGELRGNARDIELLHDVVVAFSGGLVSNSVDGVALEGCCWERGFIPDFVEYSLSL